MFAHESSSNYPIWKLTALGVRTLMQLSLIHYDFKPQQHDNPLLLATEQQ